MEQPDSDNQELDLDAELVDGIPEVLIDAVHEEMVRANNFDVGLDPEDDPPSEDDVFASGHEDEPTEMTPKNYANHSKLNDKLCVECSVEPWKSVGRIGRVTTWPESKPYDKRNISATCYLHTGCHSKATKTNTLSEELF